MDAQKAMSFVEETERVEKYRSNYLSAKRDDESSKDVLIIKRCIDRMTELKREEEFMDISGWRERYGLFQRLTRQEF